MRLASGLRSALGAIGAVALLAGCSGPDSSRVGSRSALPQNPTSLTVVPPRYASMVRRRFGVAGQHGPASASNVSPRACNAIYLSDYATGDLDVYRAGPGHAAFGFSPLHSTALYGWGVVASGGKIYAGTYADTIDVYEPCGTKVVRTLGPPSTAVGFPLGMTVLAGRLYATEWPANVVDVYEIRTGSSVQMNDPGMGLPYFLAADSGGHIWVSGWDPTFTRGQIDRCGPTMGLTCVRAGPTTLFPGGLAFDREQNLTVDDQYGAICTYRRLGYGLNDGACFRSAGAYTALAFDRDGKHLWAANVSACGGEVCGGAAGVAYRRFVPGAVAPDSRTARLKGGMPLGIAVTAPGSP